MDEKTIEREFINWLRDLEQDDPIRFNVMLARRAFFAGRKTAQHITALDASPQESQKDEPSGSRQ